MPLRKNEKKLSLVRVNLGKAGMYRKLEGREKNNPGCEGNVATLSKRHSRGGRIGGGQGEPIVGAVATGGKRGL